MAERLHEVTLETLGGGAVIERFQREWNEVLENIADLNTDPTAAREVTIKLKVKPDKARESGAVRIVVTTKLASVEPATVALHFIEKTDANTGEIRRAAYAHNPNQAELFEGKPKLVGKDA